MQELIVILLFAGALYYIGFIFYRSLKADSGSGCAKGCGGCHAVDFSKIEQQIRQKEQQLVK